MARTKKTYTCFLKEITTIEWEKNKTGGGVPSNAEALMILNQEVVEPTAPSTAEAHTLVSKVAAQKIKGKFTIPTLAAGENVIKATLFVYGKGATAAKKDIAISVGAAAFIEETTAKWVPAAAANEGTGAYFQGLEFTIECGKSTAGNAVYAVYLLLETETEHAVTTNQNGQLATTKVAGGTATVTITEPTVGRTLLVAVAITGVATGASAITDNAGNTYTLDKEAKDETVTNAQLWRAPITKSGATELKVVCPSGSATVNIAAAEFVPITTSEPVDVTGTETGVGTNASVTVSGTTRATQGDLIIAISATTASSATLATENRPAAQGNGTGLTGAGQAGGSLGWGYYPAPAEGVEGESRSTWSGSGTHADLLVAYKVLATVQPQAARVAQQAVMRASVM